MSSVPPPTGDNGNGNDGPSPSPSPCLSAYSATSSSTTDSDFDDVGSLCLDDWGFPTSASSSNTPPSGAAGRYRQQQQQYQQHRPSVQIDPNTPVSKSALSPVSGTSTPVPGSGRNTYSFASLADSDAQSLRSRSRREADEDSDGNERRDTDAEADALAKTATEMVLEEDEEENGASGFDVEDEDEEDMHANGVPAARGWRLDVRQATTKQFRDKVLDMFTNELKLQTWSEDTADPALLPLSSDQVHLKRISGAFSNAVFFVSYKVSDQETRADRRAVRLPDTVLLRVYGSGTEVLLSRRAELLILHTLSSLYEIGPHILGTFANGRVETYFDAEPIGKEGIRDLGDRSETLVEDGSLLVRGYEGRSQWVARRMRQLHEVPLDTMRTVLEQGDLRAPSDRGFGRGIENHLFARSHRPSARVTKSMVQQQQNQQQRPRPPVVGGSGYFGTKDAQLTTGSNMRESPAPLTPTEGNSPAAGVMPDTSLKTTGIEGVEAQAMAIRGLSPTHRKSSVASFDSLATSFNSQDGGSLGSGSFDSVMTSPAFNPSRYSDAISAARRGGGGAAGGESPYTFNTPSAARRNSRSRAPYPGVWRRTKRWAREAGKVIGLVDEFAKSPAGMAACAHALGTDPKGAPFSAFPPMPPKERVHSKQLGPTMTSLHDTLLAIRAIDFPRFLEEMDAFKRFVRRWERINGVSRRVLAHGDTQYSNLLMIKTSDDAGMGMPRSARDSSRDSRRGSNESSRSRSRPSRFAPFERLVVIDFEYCSPNPRAYDIANAFHEWRFDYHCQRDCWSPYIEPYPTRHQQRRWLRAYVEQGRLIRMRGKAPTSASGGGSAILDSPALPPADELALPPPAFAPISPIVKSTTMEARPRRNSTLTEDPTTSPTSVLGGQNANGKIRAAAGLSFQSPAPSPRIAPHRSSASPTNVFGAGKGTGSNSSSLVQLEASIEREIDRLEREVEVWSPACHACWALWGITFAREMIEGVIKAATEQVERGMLGQAAASKEMKEVIAGSAESFDNLRYTLGRVELFREELATLGII